ncbi:MAG: nuclear transport factor 2 family protein, partial [Thermodesulfobacteriota bacterium]
MSENSENIKIMERWFKEVWDEGRESTIDELLATECRVGGLGGADMTTAEEFKAFYRNMNQGLRGIKIHVDKMISSGDLVFSLFTVKCTHSLTGKCVDIRGGAYARIVDGQIVEADNVLDFVPMMAELGRIPADAVVRSLSGTGF